MRLHTPLSASEVTALQGGIGRLLYQGGIVACFTIIMEVSMNRKVRLFAMIVFIMAFIVSIVRTFIDFNYGIEKMNPLIPVLDIASAIVWVICMIVNCILYLKKDK